MRPLAAFLDQCSALGDCIVLLPAAPGPEEIALLKNRRALVVDRLGERSSVLRSASAVLFVGHRKELPRSALYALLLNGRRQLVCLESGKPETISVAREFKRRWARAALVRTRAAGERGATAAIIGLARAIGPVRRAWRGAVADDDGHARDVFDAFIREAGRPDAPPAPRRIVHANAGLAAGGTERQVVNTLAGLRRHAFDDIHFLGEHLGAAPGLDFFLPQLQAAGVSVERLPRAVDIPRDGTRALGALSHAVAHMPDDLAEDVANYFVAFRRLRPAVVHAWQDPTCLAAGFAARAAGVPRIVLACRNENPTHFAYHRSHMREAWRALLACPSIVVLNNSAAGAQSYAEWLGVPADRFRILRNGVEQDPSPPPVAEARAALRRRAGLGDVPVVGGILRFSAEKRPDLWLAAAASLAKRKPDVAFVLIGHGRLESHWRRAARGLGRRLTMLEPHPGIGPTIAGFDALLLTSAWEGTPNAVLEAQGLGVPVVATAAGGVPESLSPSLSAVAPADADALASALTAVLERPRDRQADRETGARFIHDRFGIERMLDETLRVYRMAG